MKPEATAVVAAALVLFAGATAGGEKTREPAREDVAWLSANAVPFDTTEPETGFSDLEALREIVGGARIVALGECTHGSHEVFRMKHRLVEFLAAEMGFTVFSIEASTPEAYRVNDYVLGGEGDPRALIGGMYFWTWNTEEVLGMVEWMRRFNASGAGKIVFTGFDMQAPDVAAGIVVRFLEGLDRDRAEEVARQYRRATGANRGKSGQFGLATWSFPVEAARGKHLVFSGHIKTVDVRNGWAGLWWRADCGERIAAAFDNMEYRGPTGTTGWARYAIELDIPEDVSNINFGVLMTGEGTAWFDALAIELDGEVYADAQAFDFDFEAADLRGFYTRNDRWYQSTLDAGCAHAGGQSLRIESTGGDEAGAATPKEAIRLATDILRDLESSRDRYLERASVGDVDWAIHNARIVQQCMRYRDGEAGVIRDYSMAENVTWILDQDPGVKVVLWAHNFHVCRGVGTMGSHLSQRYGDDYLPIGFATSRGTYVARGEGGALAVHELAAGPPDAVESYFAATGKPRLIIDLRLVGGAPGSQWLAEERPFRGVGAVATKEQFNPKRITEAFDVLVYIDSTTAAVQLGTPPAGTE